MRLKAPFLISSRLLPGLKIGDCTLQIRPSKKHSARRALFDIILDFPDGKSLKDIGNLGAPECGAIRLQSMFESALSFLSACGEARNYEERTGRKSENSDLFGPKIGEWAALNSDELSTMAIELEERPDLLID